MAAYAGRRLALGLVVVWGLTVVTFLLARVVPGDPAARWAGPHATAEEIERAREELGLDRPIWAQYGLYLAELARGDLGVSIRTHQPVRDDIRAFLPASLELTLAGMAIAVVLGVPLGVAAAVREGRWVDHLTRVLSVGGVSMPTFWLAMILQLVFFKELHLLPLSGRIDTMTPLIHPVRTITGSYLVDGLLAGDWPVVRDAAAHLALPAVTLSAYPMGLIVRMLRSSLIEVLGEDYVRTARAAGFAERVVVYRYALRNALAPALTVVALTFAYSLTGTFLIESVFDWPGLGAYAALAVLTNDYPAIVGVTIVVAVFYVGLNLAVDLAQAFLDPRVRKGVVR
ncbi:MAG: ABC transporter permease [Clostridia bacterium]|nr:ABC transporter permease [Clostridia bacterium]